MIRDHTGTGGADSEAEPTESTQAKMSSMNNRFIMNRIAECISDKRLESHQ